MDKTAAKWAAINHIKAKNGGNKAMMAGVFAAFEGSGSSSCTCLQLNNGTGWHGPYGNGHHPNCRVEEVLEGEDLYYQALKGLL